MLVTKRNGRTEELDLNKMHAVLDWACNGNNDDSLVPIKGVSVSEIEMRANPHFYTKMPTSEIHTLLIKAASELITEDAPNYDWVAARLVWFAVRKEAFQNNLPPHLRAVVRKNIERGIYTPELEQMYSDAEWDQINGMVVHARDDLFRYAGAMQMRKKYLVQNRKTKKVFESFQLPYILASAILFATYPKETRLSYVKRFYDAISQHFISMPTPIMAGLRTKVKQFSSCTKIDVGDSLPSITSAATAIVEYASRKAGIGVNIGALRAEGQPVRGGDAVTTGVLPFAKLFNAALKSCSQGAVRGASATFNYPVWHLEFERLIELKNNKGTDETRLRTVDYCIHLNRTMYQRLVDEKNITFFSPDEVPDLYAAFYGDPDRFDVLYEQYENDPTKTKKVLPAKVVFAKIVTERFDTGRIYIMNADHVNTHSSFYEPIRMTNLCVEITLPTEPVMPDAGLVALCTLLALNWGKITSKEEMMDVSELAVRGLDSLLDYQDYPIESARRHTMHYRPLGVGVIGLAHFLAKNYVRWGEPDALEKVEEKMEQMAYGLTKASMELAKERGSCPAHTKYHDGILPIDTCKGRVHTKLDWATLRSDLKKYGIRNATLMALMPSETSSQLANETNGIEPPKDLISIKGSKDGVTAQVVPEFSKLHHAYETVWDVRLDASFRTIAVLQRYVDQAISTNTSYNPKRQEITTSLLMADLLLAWKLGLKTLYYNNTLDGAGEDMDDADLPDGCGDACKI